MLVGVRKPLRKLFVRVSASSPDDRVAVCMQNALARKSTPVQKKKDKKTKTKEKMQLPFEVKKASGHLHARPLGALSVRSKSNR